MTRGAVQSDLKCPYWPQLLQIRCGHSRALCPSSPHVLQIDTRSLSRVWLQSLAIWPGFWHRNKNIRFDQNLVIPLLLRILQAGEVLHAWTTEGVGPSNESLGSLALHCHFSEAHYAFQ